MLQSDVKPKQTNKKIKAIIKLALAPQHNWVTAKSNTIYILVRVFMSLSNSEVVSRQCPLVWGITMTFIQCCHTGMPCYSNYK